MDIELRTISIADANQVQLLSKQLGYELGLDATAEQINAILSSENDFAVVALIENKVVGWIHVFKATRLETKPFAEIGGLVVDENFRSKGIGRKLVEATRQWCLQKHINDLRVRSNVKRIQAHQFYSSTGFSELKEQKVFKMNV